MMKKYKRKNRSSPITHYKSGKNFITVKFYNNDEPYIYSYLKTGRQHVEKMKELAEAGKGLATYISQHQDVKENYD